MLTVLPRRLTGVSLAVLLGAAGLALGAPSAGAASNASVTGGSADWGYKQSFRTYVAEETGRVNAPTWPQERASISVGGGATFDGNVGSTRKPSVNKASYSWPATGGSINPSTGKGTVRFGGSVGYSYPNHYIGLMRFSNPTVVLDGKGGGSLRVDLRARLHENQPGETAVSTDKSQFTLATLSNANVRASGSTVTLSGAPATLTSAGAAQTDGFYSAGEQLDPVSFTVTVASSSSSSGSSGSAGAGGSNDGKKSSGSGSKASASASASSAAASASASASASAKAKASASAKASGSASPSASASPSESVSVAAADLAADPASSNDSGVNTWLILVIALVAALAAGGAFFLSRARSSSPSTGAAGTKEN